MDEPQAPYFETALFHQALDAACQVYYTVENPPLSTEGGPHLRTFAWGKMRVDTYRISDGLKVRSIVQDFSVAGAPYNMAAYPPVDTSVGVQCKPPVAPAAPAGYRNVRAAVKYEGAMIGDLVSGAAAVARPDPIWPPQPEV